MWNRNGLVLKYKRSSARTRDHGSEVQVVSGWSNYNYPFTICLYQAKSPHPKKGWRNQRAPGSALFDGSR